MKAKYINPFIKASTTLFREFLNMTIEPGTPVLLDTNQKNKDISALIGLAGETTGAVVLTFSNETALKIVSGMTGQIYTEVNPEVIDGVGELVNIIAGNAKKDLTEFQIVISLPGVITGKDYKINWPEGIPVINIPFTSNLGEFGVQVSLKDQTV